MKPPVIPQDWPFREVSRHVPCRPHLWHVQEQGSGPVLLLIHGAGGASHSFRHLVPHLRAECRVVAVDLPGQGFTALGAKSRCGLDAMAEDLAALIRHEGWEPMALIGHSAGAAIALRLAEMIPVRAVVGINAALGKFDGLPGWIFPIMARLLALTPFVPQAFSRMAGTPQQVRQLITSTGSQIDAEGEAQYLRLIRSPSHVGATLAMMAQWNLDALTARLPHHAEPCLLITASNDRAVPPSVSQRAAARMPNARWVDLPGHGHLLHEESAEEVARLIEGFLRLCESADG